MTIQINQQVDKRNTGVVGFFVKKKIVSNQRKEGWELVP
jgi:hypothetical protein